jgi:hypothetical protein
MGPRTRRSRDIGELQLDSRGVDVDHKGGARQEKKDRVNAARREK